MRTKTELLGDLQGMLQGVFAARSEGGTHARISRAQGYVDGYMRALTDTGIATHEELLALVTRERERASGPALRTLEDNVDEVFQVA
jgi:hypothetical protein